MPSVLPPFVQDRSVNPCVAPATCLTIAAPFQTVVLPAADEMVDIEVCRQDETFAHLNLRRVAAALVLSIGLHGGALFAAWHLTTTETFPWRLQVPRGENRPALAASIAASASAEPAYTEVRMAKPPAAKPIERPPATPVPDSPPPTSATKTDPATARRPDESFALAAASEAMFTPPEVARRAAETDATEPPPQVDVVDSASRPRPMRTAEPTPREALVETTSVASAASTASAGADVPQVPTVVHKGKTHYPPESEAAGEQGDVWLWVRVDARGGVIATGVEVSSGYPRLDEAALAAIRQWRYAPATEAGPPRAAEFLERIAFRLERKSAR